jgi:signal transduction histidine kinase
MSESAPPASDLGPAAARHLLLLADDESELLARARGLLVPLVGDELALARAVDPAAAAPRPALPAALPWPPVAAPAQPAGRIWWAPGPDGGWAELDPDAPAGPPSARWFAARMGGTPSAGWVLVARSPERPPVSRAELDLLAETAFAAGFALVTAGLSRQVRGARAAADAAAHRWAALARLNARLVRSPDYDDTIDALLHAVVPYLADWALVELREADSGEARRAGRHANPASAPLLDRLEAFPGGAGVAPAAGGGVPGDGLLVPCLGEGELGRLATAAERAALDALAPRSLAVVPLAAEGVRGTLTLVAAESGQVYTPDDLALFRTVGQQAALALASALTHRAAERARREREEVLAMVSHDLKNPLNTVGFAAAILETPEVPEARRSAQVAVIRRAVGEMNELIDRLLDAARIDSGRFHVDPEPESLDALVAEALHRAAVAAERAGVRCAPPPPCGAAVLADRGRLLQVFANLLQNAISFSPRGGIIRVELELAPDEARVAIRDEGPGMDAETQRHIFDRYWQARQAGRAGAGLGLSIARGIVEAHGGRIAVESVPGDGSTFSFSIPRVSGDPPGGAGTHAT